MAKHLHLAISTLVIVGVGFIYGANPTQLLPLFFDFEVNNLELKNIFRAMMGLYVGFAAYWVMGMLKPQHWRNATLSNVIFMGGLAFGRLISTAIDGVSVQYTLGLVLELVFMAWGIYNLRRDSSKRVD
ncbi:MAG: DUF4345 domain-containing protein [Bacteroidota bacterium]